MSTNTITRRRRTTRRLLGAIAAGAVLAGTGVGYAAASKATPLSFLQSLNNRGVWVYDTTAALATGYRICNELNVATGDVVVNDIYVNAARSDVPTVDVAVIWLVTSVEELCPWHDHRGQVATA